MATNFNKPRTKKDPITKIIYYSNMIYPYIPPEDNDIYIQTRNGDRLDLLAEEYYGNSALYWVIVSANPENVRNDSFFVTPGIQIRIPSELHEIEHSFNLTNIRR